MSKRTQRRYSRRHDDPDRPDKTAVARMWHVVGQTYLLWFHTPECFALLCDLERVLHGEEPLAWNLVPRYRRVMGEAEKG